MIRVSYVEALARLVLPPAPPPRPLAAPAYLLLLPARELAELMRAQSQAALELARQSRLEVPRANH